jgi:hypothetical protein
MVEGNEKSEVQEVVSVLVTIVKYVAGIESASAELAVTN